MSTDIFPIPSFRTPEDNAPDWMATAQARLAKDVPTIGKSQRIIDAFTSMNTTRRTIASICNDSAQFPIDNRITEGFIQGPVREYTHLLHYAQSHMPLNGENIKGLTYQWRIGTAGGKKVKKSSANSGFEFASILTVAANCYARVAQRDILLNGVEGVKAAYRYFQNAAGISEHIGTKVLKSLAPSDRNFGGELSEAGNGQMTKLYLAFAHHTAFLKAELEMPTKYSLLSKLAMEGSNQYLALSQLAKRHVADGQCPLKEMPLDIEDSAMFHSHLLKAKANFLLALEQLDKQAIGVAIGRCNNALDALNLANQLANNVSKDEKLYMQQYRQKVDTTADKAVHENSTLYFERVAKGLPDPDAIGKPMGKPTPFDQIFVSAAASIGTKAADPFFGIIPLHVLSKVNEYRNRSRETIKNISESVASHRTRTSAALATYGVHSAIQVATSENQTRGMLPADLRNRILAMRGITDPLMQQQYSETEAGNAIDALVEQIAHVNEVVSVSRQQIADIEGKLQKEDHEDQVKRECYGPKVWGEIRKPSAQTEDGGAIFRALEDFRNTLVREVEEPLAGVKSLLHSNLRDVCTLDWPIGDLNKLMPFSKTTESKKSSEAAMAEVKKLQKIIVSIDEAQKAQTEKLDDLRAVLESDEIAHLLSATPIEQHDEVMESSRLALNDRISLVTSHMNEVDELLAAAAEAMAAYATVQSTDSLTGEVQKVCSDIMGSLNVYDTVSTDATAIGKLVDNIVNQIESTSLAADSFILARQIEMEDLVVALDRQVAAKISEMEEQRVALNEAAASRKRQEELKARLASLESSAPAPSQPATVAQRTPQNPPPPQQSSYGNVPQWVQPQPSSYGQPPAMYGQQTSLAYGQQQPQQQYGQQQPPQQQYGQQQPYGQQPPAPYQYAQPQQPYQAYGQQQPQQPYPQQYPYQR